MAPFSLSRLDDLVGETLERAVRTHHARRLKRRGSAEAIDPPADGGWASTASFAPRSGCRVEPFLDGDEALPRIAAAIRSARSHVHLAGWHFDPSFRLEVGGSTLRELLAEAAEHVDVRVLAWAGGPLPLFHPDRGEVRQACHELAGGTRISMALDARERPFHCHHEKLVVVDDETAFVGGIDLTALSGDRLDSNEHPRRDGLGWHDTAIRLEGPIVADVARHFHARWHAIGPDGLLSRIDHSPSHQGSYNRSGTVRTNWASTPSSTAAGRRSAAICGRFGRPRGSCISRASSSGRRRSPACSPRSCAIRPATTSA